MYSLLLFVWHRYIQTFPYIDIMYASMITQLQYCIFMVTDWDGMLTTS